MGGRVQIRRGHYNPTSDAVWLAAAISHHTSNLKPQTSNPTPYVLDVGIGTGAVSLCMLAHNPNLKITGIDISDEMLTAAADNTELNGRDIELINADITKWRTARTFDIVVTNPPYFRGSAARHNAHHNADIYEWVSKCIARVKPHGYFYTIVDAAVADKVIAALHNAKAGDIEIITLLGTPDAYTSERAIIRARAGTNGPTRIFSPLSMQDERVLRESLTIDALFTTI